MVYIKEGLDRSLRKNRTTSTANSPHLQRIKLERALCPSSATLIIVPLALLEHWYVDGDFSIISKFCIGFV